MKAKEFRELLKENLDEDTRRRRRLLLVQPDVRDARPRDGVSVEEVGKELRNVAQLIGLVTVNGLILLSE